MGTQVMWEVVIRVIWEVVGWLVSWLVKTKAEQSKIENKQRKQSTSKASKSTEKAMRREATSAAKRKQSTSKASKIQKCPKSRSLIDLCCRLNFLRLSCWFPSGSRPKNHCFSLHFCTSPPLFLNMANLRIYSKIRYETHLLMSSIACCFAQKILKTRLEMVYKKWETDKTTVGIQNRKTNLKSRFFGVTIHQWSS